MEFMLKMMRKAVPKTKNPSIALGYATMRFEAAKAAAPYVHPKPQPVNLPKHSAQAYASQIRSAVADIDKSVTGKEEK